MTAPPLLARNSCRAGAPRILFISQNRPLPRKKHVWNQLLALREAGCEVVAICPRWDGAEAAPFERLDGIDIHRYPQPIAGGSALSYVHEYAVAFRWIRRLARQLAGERGFDVVQASNPPDFVLPAVRFLKHGGARLVFDHHDLAPELFVAKFGHEGGLLHRLMLAVESVNYRVCDLVIATNESYRRVAIERGGVRPQDVFVVRSGPDLDRFRAVPADPALRDGRSILICFIGAMAPQDGIDHAIRALARVRERHEDWHAVFAGDGDVLEDLRRLSRELGLDDHIEFPGWLEDRELRALLSSSDICLAPDPKTPLSDASTLVKIAEYMAMSRPIVSYDLTESRITAGESAIYAKANDPLAFAQAIEELIDDPQRRRAMGELGRRRVEELFSWERSRAELLAAYSAVLERPPRAARARSGGRITASRRRRRGRRPPVAPRR